MTTDPPPRLPRPTPIPVKCPNCGKRMEANAYPGSKVEWECKRCEQWVTVEIVAA